MQRRSILAAALGTVAGVRPLTAARAETVGVTDTEIKIGNTTAYSGPASAYGVIQVCIAAYWRMINDRGGINGRQVTYISLDDGYVPAKTVEQVRRLVEQDKVAFILNSLGTAHNTAIERYLNQRKVPQLLLSSAADKFGDYHTYPWSIGWQPSSRTEAQIYAKHALATIAEPRIALLYQNDDFGKDYLIGMRDVFGSRYDEIVVKAVSYEVTDPTVDSQIISLAESDANILLSATTPKAAVQTIRKVFDIGWKPRYFQTNNSISPAAVMMPAGAERGIGIITAGYRKDWTDPAWQSDPGMLEFAAFMRAYLPSADITDSNYTAAFGVATTALQILRQCEQDLSRENIMRQATNLKDLEIPVLLPGIKVNTSPTNYHPIRQMHLQRWTGKSWELFGDLIEGSTT